MKKRLKTLSKYFYNDEILSKEADGTIHLKEGVKRVNEWPSLKSMYSNEDADFSSEHINEFRLIQDKIDLAYKIRDEEKDYN